MRNINPRCCLERFGHQVLIGPNSGSRVELAGIGFGILNEFAQRCDWQRPCRDQHRRVGGKISHRHQDFERIIVELVQERCSAERAAAIDQQRVSVGRSSCHHPQRDRAARTAHVLDHDRLTDLARHRLSDHPPHRVGRTTCRKCDDELNRPRRVGLRARHARQRRQAGGARGQMEELAALKLHRILP